MTPPRGIPTQNPVTPVAKYPVMECKDDACLLQKIDEGVDKLKNGDQKAAKDTFLNVADCAVSNKNVRYEILARALVNLSEGQILAAQSNLEAIREHPYAQQLLETISSYDHQVIQLQTLYLVQNLIQEEKTDHPNDESLSRAQNFVEEALQLFTTRKASSIAEAFNILETNPQKNYQGMSDLIKGVSNGLGGEIIQSAGLANRLRAETLFRLIDTKLLTQKRMGTVFLIAKMYQKDPSYGNRANQYLMRSTGLIQDPAWISTDFLDQGTTYFLISLLSLAAARYASRGVWAYLTRNSEAALPWWKRIAGAGLSLGVSTATYFISEKALMGISGFDGKVWPSSGSELAKELGADMIVMGLSNLMGGVFTWGTNRIFKPISAKIPWPWRIAGYAFRTPFRAGTWLTTSALHGTVLYATHRWEDNHGMIERFRQGKPTNFLPQSWMNTAYNAQDVIRSEKILNQYQGETSKQIQEAKSDEIYHQVHDMKRWINKLMLGTYSQDQVDTLLGIFWMAQHCGSLNESAQDNLALWMKEKRYDKVNQYLFYHNIPLQLNNDNGRFILPELPPGFSFPQTGKSGN